MTASSFGPHSSGDTSSFGFRDVDAREKVRMVRGVFDSVASNYDLMNDLMSGGVHRLWKDAAAAKLNPRPGETILDVAGGTGDMARRYSKMARRVLKPGGRFLCLEFSRPTAEAVRKAYDAWSFHAIPKIGGWVAKDRDSYQYLVESIRRFPDQNAFKALIEEAGFSRVAVTNLSGGVAAIHFGWAI